ncbi:MAG: hypothetical protein A3E01_09480 [Gammaproteobacteria bacterium RIFCSPHIGHO2_12_FULL_63_22]|nr:MAG: hypothetical protein A3E01_09480 [Gammaproteobacteria bacterium RIFCSPHIGHO2_12_FULL_63_22]
MNLRHGILFLLLAWLAVLAPAAADERILSYDSDLTVRSDGSLDVVETIRVRAEGNSIRRGIYRDFPTRYKDRFGDRVVVDFELLGVERDGKPEPNFTERLSNGVRINTGNDDFLPTPAEFTFTIRYRTTRQLGFFADHDELYWNVTGLGWEFPIDVAQARVHLPTAVPSASLALDGYTGRSGEKGKDYQSASPAPGEVMFRSTRALAPGEGLTISVGFPKGMIAEPTRADRWRWFLRDNRGVLVGLAGLLLLTGFYAWRWLLVGRDPPPGPIFPRYQPPEGFSPGELRVLRRMGHDHSSFAADIVDMAVRGFLQIHEGGKGAAGGWRLVREPGASLESLAPNQRPLAARLFKESGEIELKNTEAARVSGAIAAHASAIGKQLRPRYYATNAGSLWIGIGFSIMVGLLAFAVSGGNGILALVVIGVLGLVAHGFFAYLVKAPSPEGRRLLDEVEGLRLYMGVAERDELKSLPSPSEPPLLDAARYEALLPYAMALDVEEAWTGKFIQAVGAATAQQSTPTWYHGSNTGRMGLASMGSSLGGALTQQISSSSTPPGSSSGGGGGGSSGGGGGGGGGGGR